MQRERVAGIAAEINGKANYKSSIRHVGGDLQLASFPFFFVFFWVRVGAAAAAL